MKKPNFFILGAPKCGTTSMDEWLRAHPQIHLAPKECHYFNTSHNNRKVTNLDDYHRLFAAATDAHLAIGETSVRYLYCTDAVANILKYNPAAQFIVMLRNPIEMVYSWHSQIYLFGLENVRDFATAWHLQPQREAGERAPPRCTEVKMLYYGKVCRLGEQLQRLYAQASPQRVHLIFFEDLQANPRRVYLSVLDFLGVPDDHRQQFALYNPAKTHRIHALKDLPTTLGKLKTKIGLRAGFGILNYLVAKNIRIKPRAPLSPQMRQILVDYFREDIDLLMRQTGRRLQHWLQH